LKSFQLAPIEPSSAEVIAGTVFVEKGNVFASRKKELPQKREGTKDILEKGNDSPPR